MKQVVGSILRDEELVDEGRIQQAKVTELRRAVELEVRADQTRAAGAVSCGAAGPAKAERTKAEQDASDVRSRRRDQPRCRAASERGARRESRRI